MSIYFIKGCTSLIYDANMSYFLAQIVVESFLKLKTNFLLLQKSDQRKLFLWLAKMVWNEKTCNVKLDWLLIKKSVKKN